MTTLKDVVMRAILDAASEDTSADRREELRDMKSRLPLPEARCAHLYEVLERSRRVYSEGDFVTITQDSGLNPLYIGEPHIVLCVNSGVDGCERAHRTVLVATIATDGVVVTEWIESHHLEPWVAPWVTSA